MYLIYCHTNKINGKRYVGYTSHVENPNTRWRNGLGYLNKHHKVFATAIEKYGWDNFDQEILENSLQTLEEAWEREKYWIAHYHSYIGDPECWGYNATAGGDGSRGRIMSDEEREYRRQLKLGTKASEETKRKMSETRRGKPQNMTTKKIAQCKSCVEAMNAVTRRPVVCVETGECWESIMEASRALDISPMSISACLNGRTKTVKHKTLHMAYVEK